MNVQGGEAVMTDQSSAKSLLNIGLCQIQLQGQISWLFSSKHQMSSVLIDVRRYIISIPFLFESFCKVGLIIIGFYFVGCNNVDKWKPRKIMFLMGCCRKIPDTAVQEIKTIVFFIIISYKES